MPLVFRIRHETADFSLDTILGQLKEKEQEAVLEKSLEKVTANVAKASGAEKRKHDNGAGRTCSRCHRTGHLSSACWATKTKEGVELPPNGIERPPFKRAGMAAARQATENAETGSTKQDSGGSAWKAVAMEALVNHELPPGCWIVDSGASHHMTPNRGSFVDINEYLTDVSLANGKSIKATGIGRVEVPICGEILTLNDVLYVPELDGNLLSIGAAKRHGITVEFGLESVLFKQSGTVVGAAIQHGSVYIIKSTVGNVAYMAVSRQKSEDFLAISATTQRGSHELIDSLEPVGAASERVVDVTATPPRLDDISRLAAELTPENPKVFKNRQKPNHAQSDYEKWHRRFGHAGAYRMKRINTCVEGIDCVLHPDGADCSACLHSKMIRVQNKSAILTAKRPLERVYSDIWGPYQVDTLGGNRYFVTFSDEYSRLSALYLLKKRIGLYEAFENWKNKAEEDTGEKLRVFRCDGAEEYGKLSRIWTGVDFEITTPYTPEQNGFAERLNRTITECVRCQLYDSQLPMEFWGEAALTANYLRNRLPLGDKYGAKTPYELYTKRKPHVEHLRPFGCVVHCHIPKEKRAKLENTSYRGVFVGYTESNHQFRVWNPLKEVIEKHSHVLFLENEKGGGLLKNPNPELYIENWESPLDPDFFGDNEVMMQPQELGQTSSKTGGVLPPSHEASEPVGEFSEDRMSSHEDTDLGLRPNNSEEIAQGPTTMPESAGNVEEAPAEPSQVISTAPGPAAGGAEGPSPPELRSQVGRLRKPSAKAAENAAQEAAKKTARMALQEPIYEPSTYKEAMTSPTYQTQWAQAIDEELNSLAANGTWELVELPKGRQPITSKWVFKVKYTPSGLVNRFKARLVARGFSQQYGIDYEETFAPTLRFDSLRMLLAIAAHDDLHIHQMDVVSAYLAGRLEEEIYMEPPEGLPHDSTKRMACRLIKGLYGLKQSGRVWNNTFRSTLTSLGFSRLVGDNSVFLNGDSGVIIALYVDDLLIFSKEIEPINSVKAALHKAYKMKDLGEADVCLGIQIRRNRKNRTLTIDQHAYVTKVLKEFGMEDSKPVSTPIDSYEYIKPALEGEPMADQLEYQKAVGSLMYAMTATRPDLAFVVGKFSQFCHSPSARNRAGLQRVFRYLKGTKDLKITYSGASRTGVFGYTDSDFAADPTGRKSTHAYVFALAGGPISWCSRKQRTTSTSTTEAEYIGCCNAAKQAAWITIWLKGARFTRFLNHLPVQLLADNQSSMRLSKNAEFHSRTKHIDVQYHYIREAIEDGLVTVSYIPTNEMAADSLTKPLPREQFLSGLSQLGLMGR